MPHSFRRSLNRTQVGFIYVHTRPLSFFLSPRVFALTTAVEALSKPSAKCVHIWGPNVRSVADPGIMKSGARPKLVATVRRGDGFGKGLCLLCHSLQLIFRHVSIDVYPLTRWGEGEVRGRWGRGEGEVRGRWGGGDVWWGEGRGGEGRGGEGRGNLATWDQWRWDRWGNILLLARTKMLCDEQSPFNGLSS